MTRPFHGNGPAEGSLVIRELLTQLQGGNQLTEELNIGLSQRLDARPLSTLTGIRVEIQIVLDFEWFKFLSSFHDTWSAFWGECEKLRAHTGFPLRKRFARQVLGCHAVLVRCKLTC